MGLALIDVPHDICEKTALEGWQSRLQHELEVEVRSISPRCPPTPGNSWAHKECF